MATSEPEWEDFITTYLRGTEEMISPRLFRQWSAISCIAGALERRTWFPGKAGMVTWPNLFVLLVAPPGVGKYVIEDIAAMWRRTKAPGGGKLGAFRVAPSNMTKASLLDKLAEAKVTKISPSGPVTYHSLLAPAEEFSVLLPDYDMEYIGTINYLWNNPPQYEESRRTGSVKELKIENPQLNILGGVQPAWMAKVMPEDAWSTGLARRFLMVYSSEAPYNDFLGPESEETFDYHPQLLRQLTHISAMHGQFQMTPEAREHFREWYGQSPSPQMGGPPVPSHSKLAHYNQSRNLYVTKLSMISAVSRRGKLLIELIDVMRALEWLLAIEAVMPDIFRAMVGKSDASLIDDMHAAMTLMLARQAGRGSIPKGTLVNFLHSKVPSERVEKIIFIAESAGIISRIAGEDAYRPVPKHQTGME